MLYTCMHAHCHVYRVNRGCPRGHMLVTHGRNISCCGTYLVSRNVQTALRGVHNRSFSNRKRTTKLRSTVNATMSEVDASTSVSCIIHVRLTYS